MKWKYIEGTNYLYKISEYGDIYRTSYCNIKPKARREYKEKYYEKYTLAGIGYKTINLKGYRNPFYIHVLVAKTFIPNPENKPCVNHIDGNKLNNHISNLEWVTYLENSKHASENNLINRHSEKRKKQAPINAKIGGLKTRKYSHIKDVYEINYLSGEIVKIYKSIYDVPKRTEHVITSRNRAIKRLLEGTHSGKTKTYFLWKNDYIKLKDKITHN